MVTDKAEEDGNCEKGVGQEVVGVGKGVGTGTEVEGVLEGVGEGEEVVTYEPEVVKVELEGEEESVVKGKSDGIEENVEKG